MGPREALLAAAHDIERELICCDIFDQGYEAYVKQARGHDICYWGRAAQEIVLSHADRLESGGGEMPLPEGLCGNKEDHEPHRDRSKSLGLFWCHADQEKRLPYAAERRRRQKIEEVASDHE